ncbi:hypothetical protein CONPUDRAFT_167382, partial [Coniophora puteana RWD-64-598 SS2]
MQLTEGSSVSHHLIRIRRGSVVRGVGSFVRPALWRATDIVPHLREHEYIWKGRLTWVKFLYLTARYGTAAQSLLGTILFFNVGLSTELCRYLFNLYAWMSPLQAFPITIIMALRTHALYSFSSRRASTFVNVICAISCLTHAVAYLLISLTTH